MKISYTTTVHNELKELTTLIDFLLNRIDVDDEIVVQYDSAAVTKEVLDYLNLIKEIQKRVIVTGFPLNKDFASYKNNLKLFCKGEYIVNIDADEIPNGFLVENLKSILESNDVDIIFVPRINTVEGITQEHIQKWGWKVDHKGWINYPDYQTRIYRNTTEIEWVGKVHERITGYNTFSVLPPQEEYSLYHHKQIERQEKQNELYNTI